MGRLGAGRQVSLPRRAANACRLGRSMPAAHGLGQVACLLFRQCA